MSEITVAAPAKLNLFLRVLAREESGFHQIESLFVAVDLHDTIRIRDRKLPEPAIVVEGREDTGPDRENLALRAALAFRERMQYDGERGLEVVLEKRIPVGTGLGGGSSDAAATLRAMDRLHPGALEASDLEVVAARLGSDVPFFLGSLPFALVWGRGERLLELPPLPSRPVLLVVPPFRISTARAYRHLARRRREGGRGGSNPEKTAAQWKPRSLSLDDLTSWERVGDLAENDFEDVVMSRRPSLSEMQDLLRDTGARPALLSGSGSALFGLYEDPDAARAAGRRVGRRFPEVNLHVTSTLAAWPGGGRAGATPVGGSSAGGATGEDAG